MYVHETLGIRRRGRETQAWVNPRSVYFSDIRECVPLMEEVAVTLQALFEESSILKICESHEGGV